PSQSSSTSSQISADGVPGTALHCSPVPFALQTSDPLDWQAPTPALQACPLSAKSSSTKPSQSSSTSLQSSAWQLSACATKVDVCSIPDDESTRTDRTALSARMQEPRTAMRNVLMVTIRQPCWLR